MLWEQPEVLLMPKLKIPPFVELPTRKNGFWSDSWHEFIRDIQPRINERPEIKDTVVPGDPITIDDDGNISELDLGLPDGTVADEEYVREYTGERYLTDNILPEAGTEEGARHGSYRIGLLTEDDYAYFDENGKLIFYGISGIQLVIPVNITTAAKYAVFDTSGNLKYLTAEQLSSDLSAYLTTKVYIAERYITENLLEEAGTHGAIGNNELTIITQIQAGGGGAVGVQYKSRTVEVRDGWIDNLGTESDWVDV